MTKDKMTNDKIQNLKFKFKISNYLITFRNELENNLLNYKNKR